MLLVAFLAVGSEPEGTIRLGMEERISFPSEWTIVPDECNGKRRVGMQQLAVLIVRVARRPSPDQLLAHVLRFGAAAAGAAVRGQRRAAGRDAEGGGPGPGADADAGLAE